MHTHDVQYMADPVRSALLEREQCVRRMQSKTFLRANLAVSLDPFDPEELAAPQCNGAPDPTPSGRLHL